MATKTNENKTAIASTDAASEITRLHGEIGEAFRANIAKAIRVGELLAAIKAEKRHGEFGPWCQAHLPFTVRTAARYMRLYRNRDRLKMDSVSDLGTAYRLLTAAKPSSLQDAIQDEIAILSDTTLSEVDRLRESQEFSCLASERLNRHLKAMEERIKSPDLTLADYKRYMYEAAELQNLVALLRINYERAIGKLLNDLAAEIQAAPSVEAQDELAEAIGPEVMALIRDRKPARPDLFKDNQGPHKPEAWEPLVGEVRIGTCADGRIVVVESLGDDLKFVRHLIVDADHAALSYQKRGINRHWLRWSLQQSGIDVKAVDWCDPLPATAENNPAADVVGWTYPETAVAA